MVASSHQNRFDEAALPLLSPCSAAAQREFAAQGGNICFANANPLLRVPQYHRILCFFTRAKRVRVPAPKQKGCHAALFCLASRRQNGNLPHKAAIFACANAHPRLCAWRTNRGASCLLQSKRGAMRHPFCFGAGNGNRTRISCLGSRGFTTRLCLRTILLYIKSIHLSSNLLNFLAKTVRQSPVAFAAGLMKQSFCRFGFFKRLPRNLRHDDSRKDQHHAKHLV